MIVNPGGKSYYMDKRLIKILDKVKGMVQGKDRDIVIIVDGPEGSGKSVFAMQICKYLDPTFDLDDIYMDGDSFNKGLRNERIKHKAKLFDEAYTGLSSRASLSKANRAIVSNMMQMRQLNLFCVVCIPTFFLLDRYVSLFRARYLFHIYETGKDHKFKFYNRKKKKLLYLIGRKNMTYGYPKIYKHRGIFRGRYAVDEIEYRAKKRRALEDVDFVAPESRFQIQRDIFLNEFVRKNKLSSRKASEALELIGIRLSHTQILEILKKFKVKTP